MWVGWTKQSTTTERLSSTRLVIGRAIMKIKYGQMDKACKENKALQRQVLPIVNDRLYFYTGAIRMAEQEAGIEESKGMNADKK